MDANTTTDDLVLRVGTALLAIALGWLLLGVAAALVVRAGTRRGCVPVLAEAIARRALPRWVYALVAGSAIALTPLAAQAAPPSPPLPPPALPLSTPQAIATAPTAPAPTGTAHTGGARAAGDRIVVRSGDSLWRLAAEHLGSPADDARIAAAWPRWYATNRSVIGADPNLIQPGQHLRAPERG